ncbi:MAG: 4-(cytidine 5'-diphospho)-2-C-methyl-D-erythritol kinase [Gammaproteobacteria bacterium]|nr:4-(cytidine 5'-diphospho)-2-C-methyl-D-erythritol kinase [Gammaproteobacteria bacterium]
MTGVNSWPAPAKLNLFLHVTGRRLDGYHLLQTVFQFIDIADELRFEINDSGRIARVSDLEGVTPEQDLVVRAARLLQQETGCGAGVDISLIKRLPMGGGLGGGSSDAATTLLALNALWQTGVPRSRLMQLGLQLGADVPVFIGGSSAWAEGVGDRLEPLSLERPWFVILQPDATVSTGEIFGHPELTRNSPAITIRDFREGRVRNDLEPVVRALYPQIDQALNWLSQYGEARMTGTGACVFLPCSTREQAEAVVSNQPPAKAIVARGLNRHPIEPILAAWPE